MTKSFGTTRGQYGCIDIEIFRYVGIAIVLSYDLKVKEAQIAILLLFASIDYRKEFNQ